MNSELRTILHDCGLRATPARRVVLQTLRSLPSPVSHAELAIQLQSHGFDKATLFRNLSDLVEVGLARRIELGDHVWRFEAAQQHRTRGASHPHFVCNECGAIHCLDSMELTSESLARLKCFGAAVEILLRGRCQSCDVSSGDKNEEPPRSDGD